MPLPSQIFSHLNLGYTSSLLYYSESYLFLKKQLRKLQPSVVYDMIAPVPSIPMFSRKLPDCTYIAQIWAYTLGLHVDLPKFFASLVYRNLKHYPYDGFFFGSPRLVEAFCNLGIPKEKSVFIKQGVDIEQFRPSGVKSETVIMSSGRLVRQKGHEYLIKAMPKILSEKPETKLVIAGRGPLANHLSALVHKLNIEHNVQFLGYVDEEEYVRLMQNSFCFVVPSVLEAIPLTAMEAMACGTPVVSSDALGVSDLFTDQSDSLVIRAKDPDQIANACLQLFRDPCLYTRISKGGERLIHDNYTWEQAAQSVAKGIDYIRFTRNKRA
jgi:glycosyltransferase involved in cell wall biosynthesis